MINCIHCICYVLHEFSCWASAHGCCMLQVGQWLSQPTMSTESVKRRVHVWPVRLLWLGVFTKNGCNNLGFYNCLTVNSFYEVIGFQTLFWDPKCLLLKVLIESTHFHRLQP